MGRISGYTRYPNKAGYFMLYFYTGEGRERIRSGSLLRLKERGMGRISGHWIPDNRQFPQIFYVAFSHGRRKKKEFMAGSLLMHGEKRDGPDIRLGIRSGNVFPTNAGYRSE